MLLLLIEALFSPSKASPPLIEASPITATTLRFTASLFTCEAIAIPRAAEIELEAWPAVKVSYTLSFGLGKPLSPPRVRLVSKRSRRPVRILWL